MHLSGGGKNVVRIINLDKTNILIMPILNLEQSTHFPPLVRLSNGLPLVPFSLHLGHTMRVKFVSFC